MKLEVPLQCKYIVLSVLCLRLNAVSALQLQNVPRYRGTGERFFEIRNLLYAVA